MDTSSRSECDCGQGKPGHKNTTEANGCLYYNNEEAAKYKGVYLKVDDSYSLCVDRGKVKRGASPTCSGCGQPGGPRTEAPLIHCDSCDSLTCNDCDPGKQVCRKAPDMCPIFCGSVRCGDCPGSIPWETCERCKVEVCPGCICVRCKDMPKTSCVRCHYCCRTH